MEKEKEKEFEFLMAFKKYRNLKKRVKATNKDNRDLRKTIEAQFNENERLKERLKRANAKIRELRREINKNGIIHE